MAVLRPQSHVEARRLLREYQQTKKADALKRLFGRGRCTYRATWAGIDRHGIGILQDIQAPTGKHPHSYICVDRDVRRLSQCREGDLIEFSAVVYEYGKYSNKYSLRDIEDMRSV